MAVIYIRDLLVSAKHGVHPHEKEHAQNFRLDVAVTYDTDKAGSTDNLEDTLDWSALRHDIITTVQENTFNLMERLAQEVVDKILAYDGAEKVSVSIEKPDAFSSGVPGITLEAER